jgi:hypothetical protein
VTITHVRYTKSTDFQVAATSSAPPGSVTLIASITTNGVTTTLGPLTFKHGEQIYRTNFKGIVPKPGIVTVTSSAGGMDTELVQ